MTEAKSGRRWCLGWTGHRTIPNEPAVTETVRHVLSELTSRSLDRTVDRASGWFGFGSAAVGADLIVAEACLQLGIPVRIVLPCSVDDMLASTPAEHRSAVERICATSEMEPSIVHDNYSQEGHAAVAREIASKADVLIAVWNGSPARGPGGTADVVKLSKERGTRIIKIDPTTGDWG